MGVPPNSAAAGISAGAPASCEPLCPSCGYDLRGHVGEVVRCPECGREWLRNVAAAAARHAAREARKRTVEAADSAFRLVVVAALIAAFGGWRWAWGIPLACMVAGWGLSVHRVARRCGAAPGWARALATHHAWWGLGLLLLAIGLVGGSVLLATAVALWEDIGPVWQRPVLLVLQVAGAAAALFGGLRGGNGCVRRGRRAIEQLLPDAGWAAARGVR